MSSVINRAQDYLARANEAAAKEQLEKARKVATAEELKQELQELQNLKRAVSEVIESDIENLRKVKKEEHNKIDQKIDALCDNNSEFVEKAVELMKHAQEATVDTRKKTLKGVGKGIKWFRSTLKQIGDELELDEQ